MSLCRICTFGKSSPIVAVGDVTGKGRPRLLSMKEVFCIPLTEIQYLLLLRVVTVLLVSCIWNQDLFSSYPPDSTKVLITEIQGGWSGGKGGVEAKVWFYQSKFFSFFRADDLFRTVLLLLLLIQVWWLAGRLGEYQHPPLLSDLPTNCLLHDPYEFLCWTYMLQLRPPSNQFPQHLPISSIPTQDDDDDDTIDCL